MNTASRNFFYQPYADILSYILSSDEVRLDYESAIIAAVEDRRRYKATETVRSSNMPGTDLRLLSLDCGGVCRLSSLSILKKLMENIDSNSPPKPCDYFDMIGGTSTGG